MAKVAFLGLGVMGYPMAGHLKTKGGHDVTVYNRNAAKADQWVKQFGGKKAASPKEAAAGQDFVMMCVGNDNDVREVALGANGAYHGMGKGTVFVDHTTASAEIARTLYAEAKQRGGVQRHEHRRLRHQRPGGPGKGAGPQKDGGSRRPGRPSALPPACGRVGYAATTSDDVGVE